MRNTWASLKEYIMVDVIGVVWRVKSMNNSDHYLTPPRWSWVLADHHHRPLLPNKTQNRETRRSSRIFPWTFPLSRRDDFKTHGRDSPFSLIRVGSNEAKCCSRCNYLQFSRLLELSLQDCSVGKYISYHSWNVPLTPQTIKSRMDSQLIEKIYFLSRH